MLVLQQTISGTLSLMQSKNLIFILLTLLPLYYLFMEFLANFGCKKFYLRYFTIKNIFLFLVEILKRTWHS